MAKKNKGNKEPQGPATIQNRKARYDFEIIDSYEAGMVLVGTEVKSLYLGRANLTDAFCRVLNGEIWLIQADIEIYSHSSHFSHERRRDRKLLMHRKEIDTLQRKAQEKGFAIIPLKIYFKNGYVKVEIGLARGKKEYDKREAITARETKRELERARNNQD